MIRITTNECKKLQQMGYRFGDFGVLHKTHNNHRTPTYYMTEAPNALRDLKTIREGIVNA